ncbi:hypothetical protein Q4R16_11130 [Morganella morganii]
MLLNQPKRKSLWKITFVARSAIQPVFANAILVKRAILSLVAFQGGLSEAAIGLAILVVGTIAGAAVGALFGRFVARLLLEL